MLCLIPIVGGLLIMMGQHDRSQALFYYFRLEDQIPETHLLRLIEKHISFAFVREQLKDRYSETGRPSIDPELLLRILLIGYLYGISTERKLVEELRMHPAWRWFTGLGFDQEIPHHSTFSKNRHGRFQGGEDLYIDGQVEGTINPKGNRLTIGPNGRVKANVTACAVVVQGKLEGNIQASDRVDLKQSAVVMGDIATHRISIDEGAYFKGSLNIQKEAQ